MARKPKSDTGNHDEKIRSRAYHLWEQEGRPHGRDQEHWTQAETEVGMTGKGVAQPSGSKKNGDAADDVVSEVPVVKRKRDTTTGAGSGSPTRGASASRGARKSS